MVAHGWREGVDLHFEEVSGGTHDDKSQIMYSRTFSCAVIGGALTGLTTIASNGSLYLYGGASLTTPSALTNNGTLSVDNGDGGGSSFTSKGALTNNGTVQVGSEDLTSTGTLNTTAAVVNGSAGHMRRHRHRRDETAGEPF